MGVPGSAWATTLEPVAARRLLVLALTWRRLRAAPAARIRPEIWQWAPLGRMLRLGVPIGCQYMLEFGAFAFVALMMGWLGTREMAGHQVAINLASLTFMVPLGVARRRLRPGGSRRRPGRSRGGRVARRGRRSSAASAS